MTTKFTAVIFAHANIRLERNEVIFKMVVPWLMRVMGK